MQQQLDNKTSASIAYVGTKGDHLTTFYSFNSTVRSGVTVNVGFNGGTSHYDGLQIALNRNVSNGLTATVAYTYSHSLDNSNGAFATGTGSAGAGTFVVNGVPNLSYNYGNSDADQRHVLVSSALYHLPFGRGQKFGSHVPVIVDELIGGWQVNPLVTFASGTPIDIISGTTRPDLISYSPAAKGPKGGTANQNFLTYFNAVVAAPPATRPGTLSRNKFSGPGYANLDLSAFKGFHITERVNAEFRAQCFNVTNHPQFGNPDTNYTDGLHTGNVYSTNVNNTFGTISGTRTGTQRQVELALHLRF